MKHTTSAGGVVLSPEEKVLVVSQHGTSWSLPKGHIETGEDPIEAARREIYEESGIKTLMFIRPLGTYQRYRIGVDGRDDPTELKTIQIFLFTTPHTELSPHDIENPEAKWVEKDQVRRLLTHPKDRAFFEEVSLNIP